MTDAGVTEEVAHVSRAKDIAHVAGVLMHVEHGTFAGHDTCRVLTAVLQEQQAVVQKLIDWCMRNRADYAAHSFDPRITLSDKARRAFITPAMDGATLLLVMIDLVGALARVEALALGVRRFSKP